jgi:hypothetical protein
VANCPSHRIDCGPGSALVSRDRRAAHPGGHLVNGKVHIHIAIGITIIVSLCQRQLAYLFIDVTIVVTLSWRALASLSRVAIRQLGPFDVDLYFGVLADGLRSVNLTV